MQKTRRKDRKAQSLTKSGVSADAPSAKLPRQFLIRNSGIIGATLVVIHTVGLSLLFQPLGSLINSAPLIDQDWGLHFHHLNSLVGFWRGDSALWGYNPSFMAGYPSNTIQDLSIKFFEVAALGLSAIGLSPVSWFKIIAFLTMASVPWLMYFSASNFFSEHESKDSIALSAALLGTAYWWNSLPREMFFYGMIGFPTAAYLSVLGVALFYRLAVQAPALGASHFAWILFSIAILPLHVQSLVIFLPAMVVLLICQPRLINGKLCLWVGAGLILSLMINAAWLIPAFEHRADDIAGDIVEQLPIFVSTHPLTILMDYLGDKGYWTFRSAFLEKGFRLTLLILGLAGIWQLLKSERRPLGLMLSSSLAVLLTITYFGAVVLPIKAWQPLRFKIPLDIYLAIGTAFSASQWFARRFSLRYYLVPIMLALGGVTFVINLAQTESSGKLQLRSAIAPEVSAIADWIRSETPAEARVLFEESGDETGFVYDGMYLSAFLPHLTGRQLIGGPINLYNDRHHFAEFHSGKLFKRDIGAISDDELRNYLSLYNIGAVVAFHPASVKKFLSIPGLVTVDRRIGPIYLMQVNQPLSWFVAGEGKVQARADRLELSELRGREILLKYHWVEHLSATPVAKIVPVKLADDPIPFIKIIDPPPAVVLRVE